MFIADDRLLDLLITHLDEHKLVVKPSLTNSGLTINLHI